MSVVTILNCDVFPCFYSLRLVFVFHFMSKSRPEWSELARGGMVEQLQSSVGAKREARLIREVDPLGLTCV